VLVAFVFRTKEIVTLIYASYVKVVNSCR